METFLKRIKEHKILLSILGLILIATTYSYVKSIKLLPILVILLFITIIFLQCYASYLKERFTPKKTLLLFIPVGFISLYLGVMLPLYAINKLSPTKQAQEETHFERSLLFPSKYQGLTSLDLPTLMFLNEEMWVTYRRYDAGTHFPERKRHYDEFLAGHSKEEVITFLKISDGQTMSHILYDDRVDVDLKLSLLQRSGLSWGQIKEIFGKEWQDDFPNNITTYDSFTFQTEELIQYACSDPYWTANLIKKKEDFFLAAINHSFLKGTQDHSVKKDLKKKIETFDPDSYSKLSDLKSQYSDYLYLEAASQCIYGKFKEAKSLLEESFKLKKSVLGKDHEKTLMVKRSLDLINRNYKKLTATPPQKLDATIKNKKQGGQDE